MSTTCSGCTETYDGTTCPRCAARVRLPRPRPAPDLAGTAQPI